MFTVSIKSESSKDKAEIFEFKNHVRRIQNRFLRLERSFEAKLTVLKFFIDIFKFSKL